MSTSDNHSPLSAAAILDAIRIKRERKGGTGTAEEIAKLEASLLADIESFDLDAAERRARRESLANSGAGMVDPTLVFPEIAPSEATAHHSPAKGVELAEQTHATGLAHASGSLLDQLRHQAEVRQRQLHSAETERTQVNEAIDQALKHLFFYLHELVQQLNIIKPEVPREYPLLETQTLKNLVWQEGFADYRTQSQSAGAMVELATFSYRLIGPGTLYIEREGAAVDRFRAQLFDYGLTFACKEFKNARSYVERASFEIRNDISVSARWRADFASGSIILETRNLERLGSTQFKLQPHALDEALLEDFGRLLLGQPNRFRELVRR